MSSTGARTVRDVKAVDNIELSIEFACPTAPQGCAIEELEHFHCKDEGCETVFRSSDEGVREHGRNHFVQDNMTGGFFAKSDPEEAEVPPECSEACAHRKEAVVHYHCKWVSLPSHLLTHMRVRDLLGGQL